MKCQLVVAKRSGEITFMGESRTERRRKVLDDGVSTLQSCLDSDHVALVVEWTSYTQQHLSQYGTLPDGYVVEHMFNRAELTNTSR